MERKTVVVIEDDKMNSVEWEKKLEGEANLKIFFNPHFFMEYCEENPDFVPTIDFLIVDRLSPGCDALRSEFLLNARDMFPQLQAVAYLWSSLDHEDDVLSKAGYIGEIKNKVALKIKDLEFLTQLKRENKNKPQSKEQAHLESSQGNLFQRFFAWTRHG